MSLLVASLTDTHADNIPSSDARPYLCAVLACHISATKTSIQENKEELAYLYEYGETLAKGCDECYSGKYDGDEWCEECSEKVFQQRADIADNKRARARLAVRLNQLMLKRQDACCSMKDENWQDGQCQECDYYHCTICFRASLTIPNGGGGSNRAFGNLCRNCISDQQSAIYKGKASPLTATFAPRPVKRRKY